MSWLDTEFPPCIAYGAMSAPKWMTTIAANQAGYENRNQVWTQARHEYDLSFAIRTRTDYMTVLEHWHMARGQLHSFGITDPLDYLVATADGFAVYIAPGQFQLFKRYGTGGDAYNRKITRPKPDAVFLVDGVPAVPGADPGEYAFDDSTGRIVFVASQQRAISAHTPGAQHVIDLASALSPNVAPGDFLALSGVTGSAAGLLNGIEHEVVTVAADIVTLDVDTTGLTANGGTASLYVAADTVTWSGAFMVPVRYGMDRMPAVATSRTSPEELLVSVDGVSLVEVRE